MATGAFSCFIRSIELRSSTCSQVGAGRSGGRSPGAVAVPVPNLRSARSVLSIRSVATWCRPSWEKEKGRGCGPRGEPWYLGSACLPPHVDLRPREGRGHTAQAGGDHRPDDTEAPGPDHAGSKSYLVSR